MQVTPDGSTPIIFLPTGSNQQSFESPQQAESDSVSISQEAIQQAEQASLQTPGERIEPSPTPYP